MNITEQLDRHIDVIWKSFYNLLHIDLEWEYIANLIYEVYSDDKSQSTIFEDVCEIVLCEIFD